MFVRSMMFTKENTKTKTELAKFWYRQSVFGIVLCRLYGFIKLVHYVRIGIFQF